MSGRNGRGIGRDLSGLLHRCHDRHRRRPVFAQAYAGYLATLSAVLISPMIASAKSSYDTQDAHFRR